MRAAALLACLALASAACGSGAQSPAPRCATTGSADAGAFEKSFSKMVLVGGGADDPESGRIYREADAVSVSATATATTTARFCVNFRDGSGRIAADVTKDLRATETTVDLGTFEPASYVVRVSVGGTLVKNLAFVVKQSAARRSDATEPWLHFVAPCRSPRSASAR